MKGCTMMRLKILLAFICLAMVSVFTLTGHAIILPLSQLTEDDLNEHPAVAVFWNPVLNTVAYYPDLEEQDLVAEGCAYFAPLIIFEEEKPILILNVITAFRNSRFGLKAIEFTYSDEELRWDFESMDASADGFFADEGFLRVDAELLKPLQYIAEYASDDIHTSYWGSGSEPLHFSLTDNQKYSIKLFVELYLGGGDCFDKRI